MVLVAGGAGAKHVLSLHSRHLFLVPTTEPNNKSPLRLWQTGRRPRRRPWAPAQPAIEGAYPGVLMSETKSGGEGACVQEDPKSNNFWAGIKLINSSEE